MRSFLEQLQFNIDTNLDEINRTTKNNVEMIAVGKYPVAYRNMGSMLDRHFDTALLRWRRGELPVADMEAALRTSGDMLNAITQWQLDDETLVGQADAWNLVSYIAFFLDRPAVLPEDRMPRIRADFSDHAADVALDYLVIDSFNGRDYRDDIAAPMERLASKKRQMLAVDSYRTYFDLLDARGDAERIAPLVQQAEANYSKRARNGFYSGGPTYMGGNGENPYVVDFQLAAVLKHIGWDGDSVHQWRWCI